jgi:curli biogenesis system outer membrane secretion channel CsgG
MNLSAVKVAVGGVLALTLGLPAIAQEQAAPQRIRIGVGNIEYRAPDSDRDKRYSAYGRGAREDTRAFIDMLTTALVKTQKFDVIERDRMEAILQEQGMGDFGLTDGYSNLHLTGLDYVVIGAITQYGVTEEVAGFGGFGTAKKKANMSVDVRVLDVENGTTAIAESVGVVADGSRGFAIEGVGARVKDDAAQLLGNVMRTAARDITFLVVSSVYPIRIAARAASGEIILNYGDGLLADGDTLHVYSEGETFTDPTTGEVLGSEEELVARITVTSAESRFSKAQLLSEYSPVEAGMIAKIVYGDPEENKNKGRKFRR